MWKQQHSIAPGRCFCPNLYRLGTSLEDWAASVLEMLSSQSPIVAVGSSMGGSCAIEMARQAPERISGLILVGAKAGHRPDPQARDAYTEALRASGIIAMWPNIANLFSPTTPKEVVHLASSIAKQQQTGDLINAVRVFHSRRDLEHVLTEWQKPYLVISGDRDPMFPKGKSQRISNLGPNGRLHIMTECGHFVNMERPEEFNRVVEEFVATQNLNNAA